jgi:hypothetical protein
MNEKSIATINKIFIDFDKYIPILDKIRKDLMLLLSKNIKKKENVFVELIISYLEITIIICSYEKILLHDTQLVSEDMAQQLNISGQNRVDRKRNNIIDYIKKIDEIVEAISNKEVLNIIVNAQRYMRDIFNLLSQYYKALKRLKKELKEVSGISNFTGIFYNLEFPF